MLKAQARRGTKEQEGWHETSNQISALPGFARCFQLLFCRHRDRDRDTHSWGFLSMTQSPTLSPLSALPLCPQPTPGSLRMLFGAGLEFPSMSRALPKFRGRGAFLF